MMDFEARIFGVRAENGGHSQAASGVIVWLRGDDGQAMTEWAESGELLRDNALLVLFNAWWGELPFTLPTLSHSKEWRVLVDTAAPPQVVSWAPGSRYPLQPRSLALLSSGSV